MWAENFERQRVLLVAGNEPKQPKDIMQVA